MFKYQQPQWWGCYFFYTSKFFSSFLSAPSLETLYVQSNSQQQKIWKKPNYFHSCFRSYNFVVYTYNTWKPSIKDERQKQPPTAKCFSKQQRHQAQRKIKQHIKNSAWSGGKYLVLQMWHVSFIIIYNLQFKQRFFF